MAFNAFYGPGPPTGPLRLGRSKERAGGPLRGSLTPAGQTPRRLICCRPGRDDERTRTVVCPPVENVVISMVTRMRDRKEIPCQRQRVFKALHVLFCKGTQHSSRLYLCLGPPGDCHSPGPSRGLLPQKLLRALFRRGDGKSQTASAGMPYRQKSGLQGVSPCSACNLPTFRTLLQEH